MVIIKCVTKQAMDGVINLRPTDSVMQVMFIKKKKKNSDRR